MTSYDDCTLYAGPAQIAGRGDSDSSGVWVKFTLPPEMGERAHPFRGFQGNQVQLAVVLCDDNGEPRKVQIGPDASAQTVAVTPAARVSAPLGAPQGQGKVRHFKDMKRSQQAALMCRKPTFIDWLGISDAWDGDPDNQHHASDELKRRLNINSKSELDTDPDAAKRFDALMTDYSVRNTAR